jgi:hypothetical protein
MLTKEISGHVFDSPFWDLNIFLDIFRKDAFAAEGDEFVDDTLEFTHVSGPRVMAQNVHRLRRDDCDFAPCAGRGCAGRIASLAPAGMAARRFFSKSRKAWTSLLGRRSIVLLSCASTYTTGL